MFTLGTLAFVTVVSIGFNVLQGRRIWELMEENPKYDHITKD